MWLPCEKDACPETFADLRPKEVFSATHFSLIKQSSASSRSQNGQRFDRSARVLYEELRPQLGVSWPCPIFQSIRSCVSARGHRSYCVAQPKLLTSFERWH